MIDREIIINNPELVRRSLRRRNSSQAMFDIVSSLEEIIRKRRHLQNETDNFLSERNNLTSKIKKYMSEKATQSEVEHLRLRVLEIKEIISEKEKELICLQNEEELLLKSLPNIVSDDTPDGYSSENNPIIRQWGNCPSFDFSPRSHDEVMQNLDGFDPERASKLSGARFAVMKGHIARLERALIQFFLDVNVDRHNYTEFVVPYMVTRETLEGTGQLPKFEEDLFKLSSTISNQDAFLIPTAEVPITNLHRKEVLKGEDMPLKYCAFSPCFRSEAGSAGRDTKGIIRLHQFHKVELVWFSLPEKSNEALEIITGEVEFFLKELGLAYQVVARCAGDVGNGGSKGYDVEVWFPYQKNYREISSCTNFNDYQTRRLSTKFADEII